MDKTNNVALIMQMIEAAEKNIQSAKQLLREQLGMASGFSAGGSVSASRANPAAFADAARNLSISDGGKVIEGVFDGQNMIGPDGKQYPVPANYASKSKLVEGDVMKLTIADDGSFIYKQIGPIERRKVLGILVQDDKGDYKVMAEGKAFRVLLASLTYFKGEAGDEVTIVIPQDGDSQWAAVEHVIKRGEGGSGDMEMMGSTLEPDAEFDSASNMMAPGYCPNQRQRLVPSYYLLSRIRHLAPKYYPSFHISASPPRRA